MAKILRRMDTKESRDYWAFVEKVAAEVRAEWVKQPWRKIHDEHFFCNIDGSGKCNRGDGKQTCQEYLDAQLTYLECPCCGDDGAESAADGTFTDGQELICGCHGWVSVDADGDDPWINNGDEDCEQCAP